MQKLPDGPIDWLEHSKLLRRTYRGKYVIIAASADNAEVKDANGDMVFLGGWVPLTYRAFELGAKYEVKLNLADAEVITPGVLILPGLYSKYVNDLNNAGGKTYFVHDYKIRESVLLRERHRDRDLALTSENIKALFKWYVENIITHGDRAALEKDLTRDQKYYIIVLEDFLMPEDIFSAQKLSMDVSEADENAYSKEAQDLLDAAEEGMWLIRGSAQNRKEGIETLKTQGKRYYTLGLKNGGKVKLARIEYNILTGWKIQGVLENSSLLNLLERIQALDITKALVF